MASKLFVGNLDLATTREEVQALFAEAGAIRDVFLPIDRATNRPRGFAFVEYESEAEASSAAASCGSTWRSNGQRAGAPTAPLSLAAAVRASAAVAVVAAVFPAASRRAAGATCERRNADSERGRLALSRRPVVEVERNWRPSRTAGPHCIPERYLAGAIGTRTSVRIQRSTMSAPPSVFSKSKVS